MTGEQLHTIVIRELTDKGVMLHASNVLRAIQQLTDVCDAEDVAWQVQTMDVKGWQQ